MTIPIENDKELEKFEKSEESDRSMTIFSMLLDEEAKEDSLWLIMCGHNIDQSESEEKFELIYAEF